MAGSRVDVIVVGGGIVGLSAALELQSRGRRVAIIDPDDPKARASFGNAGVLSRSSIFPVAGPGVIGKLPGYLLGRDIGVRVRLASLPAILPWLPRFLAASNEAAWRSAAGALNAMVALALDRHRALAEIAGSQSLIRDTGFLRVYRHANAGGTSRLERSVLEQHGVTVNVVDAGAIHDLEPHLSTRFASGWLFPQSGSVESPGAVVEHFRAAFIARGGEPVAARAEAIRPIEDGFEVTTGAATIQAGHVVLSAGTWSARLAAGLGYRIPLAAERGYHLHLKPLGNAGLNRPVFDVEGGYVMSPMQGTIRVLSGIELGRPEDPPDATQIDAVVADAHQSLPLDPSPGHEVWMGSRPSTPDGLPIIGAAPRHPRLIFAFGHGHIGFANGPVTGLAVAQLIAGETPAFPLAPFSPARFG